jgi:hypothetical protein
LEDTALAISFVAENDAEHAASPEQEPQSFTACSSAWLLRSLTRSKPFLLSQ